MMLLILVGCDQEQKPTKREITGTVYIMTAGAETIRLPMVQIITFDIAADEAKKIINTEKLQAEQNLKEVGKSLIGEYACVNLYRLFIQTAREAHRTDTNTDNFFEKAKTHLKAAEGEWEKWQTEIHPAYYGNNAYEKMGKPTQISITDVDGKFSAQIQKSDTLLAAKAQRETPAGTETYFWLIPVPAGNETIKLELNNKTLLEYRPEIQQMIKVLTAEALKERNKIHLWLSE